MTATLLRDQQMQFNNNELVSSGLNQKSVGLSIFEEEWVLYRTVLNGTKSAMNSSNDIISNYLELYQVHVVMTENGYARFYDSGLSQNNSAEY